MFFWPLKVFVFRMYCNEEDIFLVRFPSNYHLIIMQDCNYRLHLSMNETVVRHIWIIYPAKIIWLHLINSKILSTYLFIMASTFSPISSLIYSPIYIYLLSKNVIGNQMPVFRIIGYIPNTHWNFPLSLCTFCVYPEKRVDNHQRNR